jgi:hypothetical protein
MPCWKGTVVWKSVDDMSAVESLFSSNKKENDIRIPEGKLKLDGSMPINMANVSQLR